MLIARFTARDPERKSSKASLDHFAGAYFSFSKIRIARMILPPAATDQAVTRNVPCTRCQADSHALIRASPQHENCQSALNLLEGKHGASRAR
jgi:hypothetical protein